MFDPSLPVDAAFAALGREILILDGGAPRRARAIVRNQDEVERFQSRQVIGEAMTFEIRAADMGGVSAGSILSYDGQDRKVVGVPEFADPDRLVAIVNTVPAAG